MNSKALLLFLAILCIASSIYGQSMEKIDSMEQTLDTLSGVSLVKMHSRISFAYTFKDIQKGYDWSFKSVKLAEESGDLLSKSTAYRVLGIVFDVDSKSDSAYYYFNKSLECAKELGSQEEIAMNINNLGMYHWNKGQLDRAANKFIDALLIYESLGDDINPLGISGNYNNVCLIFNELGLYEKAIPFCEKGLDLNRAANDTLEMLNNLNNLGIAYQNLDDLIKSNSFYNEGVLLSGSGNYPSSLAAIHQGLASNYLKIGQFKNARNEIRKAIKISNEDYNVLHKYLAGAAEIENKLGNYKNANALSEQGLKITDSLDISGFSANLYQELAKANFGIGNLEKGNSALEKWSQEIERTFSENNATALAQKEIEYETAEKEKQILEQEIEIERQSKANRTLALTMLAGLLLFSLGFVWWRGKTERQKLIAIQEVESKAKTDQFFALLEGEERERNRLARDLHDGLGQVLSTARMNVSALEEVPFEAAEQNIWQNSLTLIDRAVDEMRTVSHDLTATALIENNLIHALKEMSRQLNQSQADFLVLENIDCDLTLNTQQEKVIYRVIQELINNAIKYAKEAKLILSIQRESDNYIFSLHQTKVNITSKDLDQGNGIGWKNIKSRMALLNGIISVLPVANGTTFSISIPQKLI